MKLTELDPHWTAVEQGRTGQGINFLCPKCKDHFVGVFFSNPTDGREPFASMLHWLRAGATFETLSISPSIRVVAGCGWHGSITDGIAVTV